MSGFSFKGVHSSKFGIYTQDQSRTLLPPKREGKITIPGRSGYYDDVGAVYNERAESVLCSFVCPEGKTVPEVCREIAYWLSGSGRLIFDREPDKYPRPASPCISRLLSSRWRSRKDICRRLPRPLSRWGLTDV